MTYIQSVSSSYDKHSLVINPLTEMGKIFGINWIDWLTRPKNEKEEFIDVRILKIIDWGFFFTIINDHVGHSQQWISGKYERPH